MDDEQIIRNAYEIEVKDSEGWLAVFTSDGVHRRIDRCHLPLSGIGFGTDRGDGPL